MEGTTEKIKNHQRFLYWPKPIHTCQKRNLKKSRETLPVNCNPTLNFYAPFLSGVLILHSYQEYSPSYPALLPCTLFLHSYPAHLYSALLSSALFSCTLAFYIRQFYPTCLFCTPILHFYSALLTPIN
jgi:hypothetical protein